MISGSNSGYQNNAPYSTLSSHVSQHCVQVFLQGCIFPAGIVRASAQKSFIFCQKLIYYAIVIPTIRCISHINRYFPHDNTVAFCDEQRFMSTQSWFSGRATGCTYYLAIVIMLALIGALSIKHLAAQEGDSSAPQATMNLADMPAEVALADFAAYRAHQQARNPYPNLSHDLYDLYIAHQNGQPVRNSSGNLSDALQVEGEQVKVMLIMLDESSADAAVQALPQMGGTVTAHYKQWIDAWLPIDRLADAAQLPGISLVRTPVVPASTEPERAAVHVQDGSSLSQGVAVSHATAWHTVGIRGYGVRIAVLDIGFRDYRTAQEAGDLPANVTEFGKPSTRTPHGTASAEIVHDMAPGAQITFASSDSATEMAESIVQLAEDGHDIIVSTIWYMLTGPGDGTGPLADAINTAEDTYGTLYVQAAGDSAQYHWDGLFTDDGHGFQQFGAGRINMLNYNADTGSAEMIEEGTRLSVALSWNDWPVSDQDYNLGLVQLLPGETEWKALYASAEYQTGTQPPTEDFIISAPATAFYGLVIENAGASGSEVLSLSGDGLPPLMVQVPARSLNDPAAAASSFSVAALDVTTPYSREPYSSVGPTYGPGGMLTGGRDQPRIAGFANVDTFSYGPAIFGGTASAASHVAGAAALVLQANPDFTPDEIKAFLEARAIDMGDSGYDIWHGAGRLYLGDPPEFPEPSHWVYMPTIAR
jgi:subtilisin family serine protease